MKLEKQQEKYVEWSEMTNGNIETSSKWVQLIHDYNPERYEYSWDSSFLDSPQDNDNLIKINNLENDDVIRVSGSNGDDRKYTFYRIMVNNETAIHLQEIDFKEAKELVQTEYDDLQSMVIDEIKRADEYKLEEIYAQLQD